MGGIGPLGGLAGAGVGVGEPQPGFSRQGRGAQLPPERGDRGGRLRRRACAVFSRIPHRPAVLRLELTISCPRPLLLFQTL
jgi:hypothetical protein